MTDTDEREPAQKLARPPTRLGTAEPGFGFFPVSSLRVRAAIADSTSRSLTAPAPWLRSLLSSLHSLTLLYTDGPTSHVLPTNVFLDSGFWPAFRPRVFCLRLLSYFFCALSGIF